jgi:hypothetical protein
MQKKNSVVVARMVEGSRPTKVEDTTQMTKFDGADLEKPE